MAKRQIILDTETTGINPQEGHRIIEIGCVEMFNRRLTGNNFHVYLNPDRFIEQEAINIHGITNEFVADKQRFRDIAKQFFDYVQGAELVIHNAAFDVGFINHEFKLLAEPLPPVDSVCAILDTLKLARDLHPGQKNNLDALCRRYDIVNSHRTFHGALLDAEILADVYLAMTGGQVSLNLASNSGNEQNNQQQIGLVRRGALKVVSASTDELAAHEKRLDLVQKKGGSCLWRS
ncbi:MAG: DNA polymerase III subunit epsilon [Rheinheimera sp.]|nr:MAG: DNA polymerase III subunit epsilon [Rheinheimera sp.]